jgi:radical SAM protein with 4Fe4S-binding SPASM domain
VQALKNIVKAVLPQPVLYFLQRHKIAFYYLRTYSFRILLTNNSLQPPAKIRIEPASACNLRCAHCPTGAAATNNTPNRGVMSESTFNRIIKQISGLKHITSATFYLAGEPLLNPRLPEMLRRTKAETSVKTTSFTTNAMLLGEKCVEKLRDTGVDLINVSIDGKSPEENDLIRRRASYVQVRDNFLKARNKMHSTRFVVHNIRVPERKDMMTNPKPPAFLVEDFGRENVQCANALRWPGLETEYIRSSGMEIVKKGAVGTKTGTGFCTMPFDEMVIENNGDVTVCCYDITGELNMGNILETNLLDIWNGDKYRSLRKAIASFGLLEKLPDACRKCTIYSREVIIQADTKPRAGAIAKPAKSRT